MSKTPSLLMLAAQALFRINLPEPTERPPRAPHRADCTGPCCRKSTAPLYLAAVPHSRVPRGREVRLGGVLVHHPEDTPQAVDGCVLEAPSRQTVRMVDRAFGVPAERRPVGRRGTEGRRLKKGERNARRRAR